MAKREERALIRRETGERGGEGNQRPTRAHAMWTRIPWNDYGGACLVGEGGGRRLGMLGGALLGRLGA